MPGKAGRDRAHGLADRERVLEQPVAVGLVVELRRRRGAEALPDLGALAEQRVQQPPQMRVADRLDQAAQVGLHLADVERRAVRPGRRARTRPPRRPRRLDGELGAAALVHLVAAARRARGARARRPRASRRRVLPADRRQRAGASRAASAAGSRSPFLFCAQRALAHEEDRRRPPGRRSRSRMNDAARSGAAPLRPRRGVPFPLSFRSQTQQSI